MIKTVIFHIGPHKTGTTTIQRNLTILSEYLFELGVAYIDSENLQSALKDLRANNESGISKAISTIAGAVKDSEYPTNIISSEDLLGVFPGRNLERQLYPNAVSNMRRLSQALDGHRIYFVFFNRPFESWLYSCYRQQIKYSNEFSSYSQFIDHLDLSSGWSEIVQEMSSIETATFLEVSLSPKNEDNLETFLNIVNSTHQGEKIDIEQVLANPLAPLDANKGLDEHAVHAFEFINRMAAIQKNHLTYKERYNSRIDAFRNEGPPKYSKRFNPHKLWFDLVRGLSKLEKRRRANVHRQPSVENLLPGRDVDLRELIDRKVPSSKEKPNLERADIRNQYKLLRHFFSERSELAFLNALCISYLRRKTPHEAHAYHLFHRIWKEYGLLLVSELSTRWLISTLQTLAEHPETPRQAVAAHAGYIYSNLIKIYEGERALEGKSQSNVYEFVRPQGKPAVMGMDRYRLDQTDLHLNFNTFVSSSIRKDLVAGTVAEELMLRIKQGQTVFTRFNDSKLAYEFTEGRFSNAWSFNER